MMTTETEKLLAHLCEKVFLKLWSYPNPYREDSDELCDLLAIFGNHVFVFFDRKRELANEPTRNLAIHWARWYRKVVEDQIRGVRGAESYLKSGRDIFIDNHRESKLPINIDRSKMIVHKIIIVHGAKEVCEKFSEQNLAGSLAITYGIPDHDSKSHNEFVVDEQGNQGIVRQQAPPPPFLIRLDRRNPVHVFDSHNLEIILSELDTAADLLAYFEAKTAAIKHYQFLGYAGEEELLAHYFLNYDERQNCYHIILDRDDFVSGVIGEGSWLNFCSSAGYKARKNANKNSYFWDRLIQNICQNKLDGILGENVGSLEEEGPIYEMMKETRLSRRMIAASVSEAMKNFPSDGCIYHRRFIPSSYQETGYVFLQMKHASSKNFEGEYQLMRQGLLQISCGAMKNKFDDLEKIVGIAIDAPKFSSKSNEIFCLLDCAEWSDEQRTHYEKLDKLCGFSGDGRIKKILVDEFPVFSRGKIGRNAPCPCGSGKKYKKCCLQSV